MERPWHREGRLPAGSKLLLQFNTLNSRDALRWPWAQKPPWGRRSHGASKRRSRRARP